MEGPLTGSHQLLIDRLELLLLIFSPHKGLHRPDSGKSLLHHVVQLVHGLLEPAVHGRHLAHHKEQDQGQNGGGNHKDQGQPGVHPEGQPKPHHQHHRAAHQGPKPAVDGVLEHRHVGGHTGDQRGALKPVQVGKGVVLHLLILGLPDACAPAVGRPGGKPGVQQAGDQRQQGAYPHLNPFDHDIVEVPVLHPHIDEVGHQHRDHQFKDGFHQHQQAPEKQIPAIGSQIRQQPFQLPHGCPSPAAFRLRYARLR